MRHSAPRHFPRARPAPPTPAEAARAWRHLIDLATVNGSTASRGEALDRAVAADFARLAISTAKTPFPLRHHTATVAAETLTRVARGFVTAGTPADREALADLMIEAARCLDRLLINDAARVAYRATGQRD